MRWVRRRMWGNGEEEGQDDRIRKWREEKGRKRGNE